MNRQTMKDRNVKQVMLRGGHSWDGEGKGRGERRVTMVGVFFIHV
jgi:hypothetical protein